MNKREAAKLKAHVDAVAAARDWCEDYKGELEDAFGSRSEKWQESDKGEDMQQLISDLDDLYSKLDEASDELDRFLQEVE
ncbi:unnamed protein product [Sphagnum jensenii]